MHQNNPTVYLRAGLQSCALKSFLLLYQSGANGPNLSPPMVKPMRMESKEHCLSEFLPYFCGGVGGNDMRFGPLAKQTSKAFLISSKFLCFHTGPSNFPHPKSRLYYLFWRIPTSSRWNSVCVFTHTSFFPSLSVGSVPMMFRGGHGNDTM